MARTSPAASGASRNPTCPIDDHASSRTASTWRSAATLPTVIVITASSPITTRRSSPGTPRVSRTTRPETPADFDTTARNAVTSTGAPTYVSGSQAWNGTAAILNANPTITNNPAANATRRRSGSIPGSRFATVVRYSEPVTPYRYDTPNSITAVDSAETRNALS